jgi:hypothetical protein
MTRGVLGEKVAARATASEVLPHVIAQLAVLGSVLTSPALVHLGQPAETGGPGTAITMPTSDEEISRRLDEMLAPAA